MTRMPLSLGIGSYENASKPFSAQRCINMYADVAQAESLSDVALFGTPGVVSFGSVGLRKSRGAMVMDGVYYVVSGTKLFSVDSDGNETDRGTIEGIARVSMANNGLILCIVVPGGKGYAYTAATTTLAEITDVDYQTSDTVSFSDGFYVFTQSDGKNWFVSNLNDPSSIDALDFGSAELNPDDIVSGFANYDEVVIFGTETTERFRNVGGSGFPYQRIEGASYEKGCHARYTPIQWEGYFYFLGGGKNERTSVFVAGGSSEPIRISTDAIEHEIQKFTMAEISVAHSSSYSVDGVSFIVFTIRSIIIDSKTFVYNVTASTLSNRNVWQEQQTGIGDNAWRAESINFVYDKLIVSDVIDGRLGFLDPDTYTEYGEVIQRRKTTGPFAGTGEQILVHSLELTTDSGKGLISGQGSDPQVMMDFSDDGARTFSSEFWRPMGKIGEYFRRSVWRRLGRIPAHRVWRFTVSDPVKVVFIKLEGIVTGGE